MGLVDTIRSCNQHYQCFSSMQYVHLFALNGDTVIPLFQGYPWDHTSMEMWSYMADWSKIKLKSSMAYKIQILSRGYKIQSLYKPLHNIPSFIVISLNIARSAMHMGRHVSGGLKMEAYKDVDSCLAGCTGNCRAVDYDSGENSCWFHYDFSVCNQLLRKVTCTHWKAVTCGKQ